MGRVSFGDEFKRDAVAQIMERGYPAAEVLASPCQPAFAVYLEEALREGNLW
jgi:hypothetical protein